jgi:hypothetical protein
MLIQPVLAPWVVSLADFISGPMPLLAEMGSKPVAVMHQDKPLFYVLSPSAMRSQNQEPTTLATVSNLPVAVPLPFPLPPVLAPPPAAPLPATPEPSATGTTFRMLARKLVEQESQRLARGEICTASVGVLRNRLDAHVLPHFGAMEVGQIKTRDLDAFVQRLSSHALSSNTLSQYMVVMRKLLKLARREELLAELPEMPRIKLVTKSRSMLNVSEYRCLIQTARRLSRQQREAPKHKDSDGERDRFWVQPRHLILPPDLAWVISFMVNSFVRPSDIKFLQHQHVTVVRGEHLYLRLNLPETKRHDKPIVTLRPAVRVYESIQARAREIGKDAPQDYVFLPDVKDRQYALALLGFWLKWIMREAGIARVDALGHARTLYSLRHTAIMYRLLYGQGIDMLTLARNARTSVDMIERFYASTLSGEMNVGMLQSKRQR